MSKLIFISHPEVVVDSARAVDDWSLNGVGIRRATRFASADILRNVSQLWSSAERKAQETASILSNTLQLPVQTHTDLGENDRSATGFLPPDQFEAAANAFFAAPEQSFKGWETAHAAQSRIVDAVTQISSVCHRGDLAIVSHGAVGTLFFCHCLGAAIDRSYDQPHQGHYWVATMPDFAPLHGWRTIG